MPLYYFNVYNDDDTMDPEGTELADRQAARAYAINGARALASHTVMEGHFVGSHRIEITDAAHNVIDTVRFDEAVEVRP